MLGKKKHNAQTLLPIIFFVAALVVSVLIYFDHTLDSKKLSDTLKGYEQGSDRKIELKVAQLAFVSQLAAAKQLLIRGKDASYYHADLSRYYASERVTLRSFEKIASVLPQDENAQTLMRKVLDHHREFGKSFRQALSLYNATDNGAHIFADQVLSGRDQILLSDLETLGELVDKNVLQAITTTQQQSIQNHYYNQVLIVIIGAGLLGFLYVLLARKVRELKSSELLQHTILETFSDSLLTLDKKGCINSLNAAVEITFGYKNDELLGRGIDVLLSDKSSLQGHDVIEADPKTLTRHRDISLQGQHKDGRLFPLEVDISQMPINGGSGFVTIMRDISDRKAMEGELLESLELNAKIIEESPIGIALYDENGQCLEANDSVGKLIGASRAQMLEQNFYEIASWQKYGLLEAAKNSLARQENVRHEFDVVTSFGTHVFFDCIFVPMQIDGSQRLLCMADDISERKKLENDLMRTLAEKNILQGQYEAIWNSAQDGIGFGLTDGSIQACNQALCHMLGYSEAELKNKKFHEFTPEEYHQMEGEMIQHVLQDGQPVYYEKEYVDKHGKHFPVAVSAFKVKDNAGVEMGIGGIVRDITQEKKIKDQIQASEELFRLLLDSAIEGVYGIDQDGRATFCNPSCWKSLGYAGPEELIGRNVHDLIHYQHADGSQMKEEDCQIFGAIHQGDSVYVEDEVFWKKDGTSFPVEYWSSPIKKENEIIGAVVFFADVSDRKATEASLLKALEQKQTLLKEVHHRVKNNLQIVAGMMQLQAYKSDDLSSIDIEEMISRIHTMSLLHESIYKSADIAEIEASQYLVEILNNIEQSQFTKGQVGIEFEVDVEQRFMGVDQLLPIGLLVNELVTNSVKHASPETDSCLIQVSLKNLDRKMQLEVRDNGVGLPSDLNIDTQDTLGFRMLKALARQLDGTIDLQNNDGLKITITFPGPSLN